MIFPLSGNGELDAKTPQEGEEINTSMTNLNRIVMAGAITSQPPSDYVGKANELTFDTDIGQLARHDGVTAGGTHVGGFPIVGPLIAHAGGGSDGATLLTANAYNVVTGVASLNDSFILPPAVSGMVLIIIAASNDPYQAQIFAYDSETINYQSFDPIDWAPIISSDPLFFVCLQNETTITRNTGGSTGGYLAAETH